MSATFPNAQRYFKRKHNKVDRVLAEDINIVYEEVEAIESHLINFFKNESYTKQEREKLSGVAIGATNVEVPEILEDGYGYITLNGDNKTVFHQDQIKDLLATQIKDDAIGNTTKKFVSTAEKEIWNNSRVTAANEEFTIPATSWKRIVKTPNQITVHNGLVRVAWSDSNEAHGNILFKVDWVQRRSASLTPKITILSYYSELANNGITSIRLVYGNAGNLNIPMYVELYNTNAIQISASINLIDAVNLSLDITESVISANHLSTTIDMSTAYYPTVTIDNIVDSASNESLGFASVVNAKNYIKITNSIASASPILEAVGDDNNVNLNLKGKGTGKVQINGVDALTTSSVSTLTNKTFDANASGNVISNLEVADFASGVIDTDISLAANLDTKLATQKAVKTYVDNVSVSRQWKDSVRVGTMVAGTLASSFANGSTVDGVALVTGDRILIKNQAAGAENGIYIVAASGAPTRAVDADTGTKIKQASVFIQEGTTNADSGWLLTNNGTINLGSTALVFVQFSGSGVYSAGSGITLTGSQFSIGSAAITDTMIGNRTSDPTTATAYGLTGDITQHLSWITKNIKSLKGVAGNWYDAPTSSVETLNGKFHETTGHKHTGVAGDSSKLSITSITAADTNALLDSNNNELIKFTVVASAVNELTIKNNISTSAPEILATGNDTDISINLVPKGTGRVRSGGVDLVTISATQTLTNKTLTTPVIATGGAIIDGNSNEYIKFTAVTSATNEITVVNAVNGSAPEIQATGSSDANVNLKLTPKGTGAIHLNGDMLVGSGTSSKIGFFGTAAQSRQVVADPAVFNNTDNEIGSLTFNDTTYTQSEVNALRDKCEELADDCRALRTTVATLVDALQLYGVISAT